MSREKKLEHHEEERYVASIKNQPHMSLLSTTLIFPKKDTLTLHNIHRCLSVIRKLLVMVVPVVFIMIYFLQNISLINIEFSTNLIKFSQNYIAVN